MGDLDGENSEKMVDLSEKMIDLDGECWDLLMNRIFQGQSEMLMGKSEKSWRLYNYGKISSIFIGDIGDAENISPIWKSKSAILSGFETLLDSSRIPKNIIVQVGGHIAPGIFVNGLLQNQETMRFCGCVILHHHLGYLGWLKPYK